jgi:VanZ family protein
VSKWRSVGAVAGLLSLGAVSAVAGSSLTLLAGFWLGVALCALLLAGRVGPVLVIAYLSALSVTFVVTRPDAPLSSASIALPSVAALVAVALAGGSMTGPPTVRRWATGMLALGLLVAAFSGPVGGAGRMYVFFTQWLGMAPAVAETLVFYVRKGMHIGFYAVLAGVALGFARLFDPRRAVIFALAWALTHATFDEVHQTMSAGRTGASWDVGLDMVGAAVGLVLGVRIVRKRERTAC